MNIPGWTVLAGLLVAVGLIATWDESPNPAAREWLDDARPQVRAGDNGYFLLLGLFANVDDDPHEVGRSRVKAYELALARVDDASEAVFEDYPDERRLQAGEELSLLCEVEKSNCLARYPDHADTIGALSDKYRVLFERYQRIAEYPEIRSTATAGVHEPLVPHALLSSMNRLQHARMGVAFVSTSRLRALEVLSGDLRLTRHLLASSDQLVLKLLAAEMVARDLHALSELLDSRSYVHEFLPELDDELADLSEQERGLGVCIRREFTAMANLMLTLESPRAFDRDSDLPDWVMSALYKPNATVNRLFESYVPILELASLPAPALAQSLEERVKRDPSTAGAADYVLNPVGTLLAGIAAPELEGYLPVLTDLNGLLRLLRLKRAIRQRGLSASEIESFLESQDGPLRSPYAAAVPMSWNGGRQVIYFEGYSGRPHLQEVDLFFVDE